MKKVAFIIAIALVFLFGTTTVLKHKIWAEGEKKKEIVLWIPIGFDGEAILGEVKTENKPPEISRMDLPMPVDHWTNIHKIKNITVLKIQKNPATECCYEVCQGGTCIERCYPFPCP
ncbi:MAG: hypothetical protein PVJ20_12320 [Desulfobacterales bacterium]